MKLPHWRGMPIPTHQRPSAVASSSRTAQQPVAGCNSPACAPHAVPKLQCCASAACACESAAEAPQLSLAEI